MAKRSSKERAQRRRRMNANWKEFERVIHTKTDSLNAAFVDDSLASEDQEVWTNNRYLVHKETVPETEHGFTDATVVWLSIKPLDDSARHDWREFQWIKNQLCGKEWEALEIYPAESRLVDTVNQFHLWCLKPPARIPLGWWARKVAEDNTTKFGSQRKWSDFRPEDLISEEEMQRQIRKAAELIRSGRDPRSITESEINA